MASLSVLWGLVSSGAGVVLLVLAKSAIHEIEAGIAFTVATISFVGAGIIHAIRSGYKRDEYARLFTQSESRQHAVEDHKGGPQDEQR